jgi:hypothetical protein
MTRAITVRLDDADHAALTRQAHQLRVQPGTLARMLVHAALSEDLPSRADAKGAIDRLVRRSQQRPPADAVTLVNDARAALRAHGEVSSSTPASSLPWWSPTDAKLRLKLSWRSGWTPARS